MKQLFLLSDYFYTRLIRKYFLFAMGGIALFQILSLIVLPITGFLQARVFLSYELLIGDIFTLLLYMTGLLGCFAAVMYHASGCIKRSNSIYTLLTLPIPRSSVYFSFLISGMALVLTYLASYLLLIALLYYPTTELSSQLSAQTSLTLSKEWIEIGVDSRVHNGFFLAILRSPVLRDFYPLNIWNGLLLFLCVLLALTATLFYVFSKERGKVIRYLVLLLSIFISFYFIGSQTIDNMSIVSISFFLKIIVLIFLNVILIRAGMKAFQYAESI